MPIIISMINGITPRMIFIVLIPNSAGAVPLQTNIADANGGVKKDICRLIQIIRANHNWLKPSKGVSGTTMGVIIMIIAIQSMNIPSMKMVSIMAANAPHRPIGIVSIISFITRPQPSHMNTPTMK